MSQEPPTPEPENFAQRREFVRRSVLRANRAIAVILGVVVLLGGVLVFMIMQARQNQARAEKAEAEETEKVWNASLAQARAENLSTRAGHRAAALEAVKTAAAIRPTVEVLDEAVSALSLADLVPEVQWDLQPNAYGFECDPELKYYVVRYRETVLSMYRFKDNSHVRDFPMPVFYGPGCNVGDFMFSGTGKSLFIRYNGGGLTQWDPETGRMQRVINADARMKRYSWPLYFSADDRLMAVSMEGSAGTQFVYDLEMGEVRPLPAIPERLKYRGGTNHIRISPRGDLLAGYDSNMIYIFDSVTGEVRHSLKAAGQVETLTWDRQGARLAFSCDNWSIFTWEPENDRVVQFGDTALLPWLQDYSEDGRLLMTAGQDGVTRLWDVYSARLVCELKGVLAGWMSGDGRRIAGGVMGKAVGVWRVEQPVARSFLRGHWESRATVWNMDLSPDGRYAVWTPPAWVPGSGFELMDLDAGARTLVPLPGRVTAGFRPGHSQIWSVRGDAIHLHAIPAGSPPDPAALASPVQSIPLPNGFNALNAGFSADGRHAVIAGPGRKLIAVDTSAPDKPVTLEPAYIYAQASTSPGSATGGGALTISPDARWVVAGRMVDGGNPAVWDARSGKIVQRLTSGSGNAAFSPDGQYLVIISQTGLTCYATAGWKKLWRQSRDPILSYPGTVAITADNSLFAATMDNSRVEFFTAAGERLAAWDARELNFVATLRFSSDGRRLVAGGMEGRIASMEIRTLREHPRTMNLDWPLPASSISAGGAPSSQSAGLWQPILIGLVPVVLAAVLGTLVLRRQDRLTHEFVEATEIAAQREKELAAEREVSELKSRFVTTVSHEFRTPLGITMSAVELLRHYEDRLPPEEKAQLFDDIHSATRNMAGLMEQVLVLGRVDAGKLAYRPAPLDLDVLARKLADESLSATNRKCPIEWKAENDLSGAVADEALLRHILANLLSNGVKYSPAGTPVHFSARREGRDAVFTVRDNGIGIPEADLPKLFEAFHRGSNVGDIPGTGLGLVIIKRCVDLHGGGIRVESKSGEGTTFTVRVPAWP